MSNTIPERFFNSDFRLLVIHDADFQKIEVARMSLYALADMAGDNTPSGCRASIDREQLAHLIELIANKLEDIPEVPFKYLTHLRTQSPTQGA